MSSVIRLDRSVTPLSVEEVYGDALYFIVTGKEEKANAKLNQVRDMLLKSAHSARFCDEHTQSLMPDLTVKKFMALYGDYKYTEPYKKKHQFDVFAQKLTSEWDPVSTPWINDEGLLDMITRHITKLGSMDDRESCKVFLQKSRDLYKVNVPLELVA